MKEITISIIYESTEEVPFVEQVKRAQLKYIPVEMEITDASFEKEWLGKKSKITFKGVET